MSEAEREGLNKWLTETVATVPTVTADPVVQEVGNWIEIRLFISSTFVDTQAERDVLVKRVIPSINRKMAARYIRMVPVDLRWGVLSEESKDCKTIQKTCLNQVDKCRSSTRHTPWFLGLRTQRYGWVQNDMMPSEGFENPDLYMWIDKFASSVSSGREGVSITSLECIHAVQNTPVMPSYPTVFFYERDMEQGPEEDTYVEKNMRWIFDFEYKSPDEEIPEDAKYQYSVTEAAGSYKKDIQDLNEYLKSVTHVKWNAFKCGYHVGGARFTCRNSDSKSYGVGYTSKLDCFEKQVEEDLLESINLNFKPDSASINEFQMDQLQHENAIKMKAATFVGRTQLVETCVAHCRGSDPDNVMILHGNPGCGKSGLLAAVTHKVSAALKSQGSFTFVHVVDSCPGSNGLEKMLRRLQWSLRDFRRSKGEINISPNPPKASSDIRQEHHTFLQETVETYPDTTFLLVVDAVNQFHAAMKSWSMWWLPRLDSPSNLRVLISTLNTENNTFENAKKACPNAVCNPVLNMERMDLENMVSATLNKFNKKLTTHDAPIIGNQMELLLSKNSSPLYLIATCEALRKFGIFEEVSKYLGGLPCSITELFTYLIDEWAVENGKVFVEDVLGLICVSKDGLLENEINDLLAFKEEREKGDEEYLYESSFSRIYDSLASFLAAGGGGYLRFFHDQLKYTVRDKFLTEDFALRTHKWLSDFYLSCTSPQLTEAPETPLPAYYDHVLSQIIHHQLAATPDTETLTSLDSTLRNIYFVKERVAAGQIQQLMDEYEIAIAKCGTSACNNEVATALTKWMKFVQMYADYITQFPAVCHNMAVNQAPTSWVAKDTLKLPFPAGSPGYPLTWQNIPGGEDAMVCKYGVNGVDVVASVPAADIVVVACKDTLYILDQSSGEVQHKIEATCYSVELSEDNSVVYSGGSGKIEMYDISTGSLVGTSEKIDDEVLVWIQDIGEYIAAGTGHCRKAVCWHYYETIGTVGLVKKVSGDEMARVAKSWKCGYPAYDHCYVANHGVFSGCKGFVVGYNLEGENIAEYEVPGCVYSVAAHPSQPRLISGSNDYLIREWCVQSGTVLRSIQDSTDCWWTNTGNWSVCYAACGDMVLSTQPLSLSLRVYNFEGELLSELKGHTDCINKIVRVPGSNQALSTDRLDTTILFNLPEPEKGNLKPNQDIDEKVLWSGFSSDGQFMYTVSDNHVRKWEAKTVTLLYSQEFEGFYNSKGAVSSDDKWFYASGKMVVYRFSAYDLTPSGSLEVLPDADGELYEFAISPDMTKLLGAECKNMNSNDSYAPVWDITDFENAKELRRYDGGRMFACAIHPDNVRGAVAGHRGIVIFDMNTGDKLFGVPRGRRCFWVQFCALSNRIAYEVDWGVTLCDIETEEDVVWLKGHSSDVRCAGFARGETQLYSCSDDGTVRLFDLKTEECIYSFFNHRAQRYASLSVSPDERQIVAGNENGMLYVLKTQD